MCFFLPSVFDFFGSFVVLKTAFIVLKTAFFQQLRLELAERLTYS